MIRWRNGAKDYATEEATREDLERWAQDPRAHGLAVVGNADTGVCVIDVEAAGMRVPAIREALEALPPECQRDSVSGGRHAYVIVEGEYPHGLGRVAHEATDTGPVLLAEVRTAPNYAVILGPGRPPLADEFAPAVGDRAAFDEVIGAIAAAGTFKPEPPQVREYRRTGTGGGTGSIIGDALAAGALSPLALLPAGWEVTGHDHRTGRTYLVRPGAESPTSGNARGGSIVIHSAAVEWAEPGRGYSAADCLAAARFSGDYGAAMRWVEQAARGLVEDGQAPPDHWPAGVLEAVHEARRERHADTWTPDPQAEAGNPLGLLDWGRFWSEDPEPQEHVIPGLLLKGTSGAIYSKAGAGKSLLSLELAVNLATGGRVLGEPVEPTTVLYLDLEQDRGLVRERLEALGVDGSTDLGRLHYSLLGDWPPLNTDEGGRMLRDLAVQVGAALVVIDTTSRVIQGEENSADTFHNLYRHTGRRLKAAGIAVLRLDHSGKDEKKGQRGSSAKDSDVDVIYALSVAGGRLVNLRRTKNRPNLDGPELLQLRRIDGPLRHEPVTVDTAAEARVEAIVSALDEAGAAAEVGRDRARQILKDAGIKARNADLSAAVLRRKLAAAEGSGSPVPVGHPKGLPNLGTGATQGPGDSPGQVGDRSGTGLGQVRGHTAEAPVPSGSGTGPGRGQEPAGPWAQCPRCDRYMPAAERTPTGCTRCEMALKGQCRTCGGRLYITDEPHTWGQCPDCELGDLRGQVPPPFHECAVPDCDSEGPLWVCPSHGATGTCNECGERDQYLERITGMCRVCFWCEPPLNKPDPAGSPGTKTQEEVTSE